LIDTIEKNGEVLAIIVPFGSSEEGIHFFTPPSFSQQLAYMFHPAGHRIGAHTHREIERQVIYTQEVLFIRKGRVRVDFYDEEKVRIDSRELGAGDVIMLVSGGHGFEMLEETEMIEVKQGPYLGDEDKIRF
jgi:mannose-6-phosphate isomerase-like protein (cupin superfamily)